VMFAFWTVGVYRDRVDFPAESKIRSEQLATLSKSVGSTPESAETRFAAADKSLTTTEALRPKLQEWCTEQLKDLREGDKPIMAVFIDTKTGQPVIDARGILRLGPVLDPAGQPIAGLANFKKLDDDYRSVQAELKKALAASDEALMEIKALTAKIGDGQKAGLRFQLAEQEKEWKRSLDQHDFLQPILYNRQVEEQILIKRHKALEARLEELKAAAVVEKP
jgi:hypothetical protein